jgi:ribosome-binding protein aMBF1 (putative translation factor)
MPKTRDFARVVQKQLVSNPSLRTAVEKERLNAAVASLIYDARNDAGLTQKQLADLVGTQQSVIARLEDADYGGHSLTMLGRIAAALDRQLIVTFKPLRKQKVVSKH